MTEVEIGQGGPFVHVQRFVGSAVHVVTLSIVAAAVAGTSLY